MIARIIPEYNHWHLKSCNFNYKTININEWQFCRTEKECNCDYQGYKINLTLASLKPELKHNVKDLNSLNMVDNAPGSCNDDQP
jgi:hypothetical protein